MAETEKPIWMVVTLKSGAQIRMLVTKYIVETMPGTHEFVGLEWAMHEDSPMKLVHIKAEEVASVHTEYQDSGCTGWDCQSTFVTEEAE